MVAIINTDKIDDARLPKERNFTVYCKNIFNKQFKKELPFVRVIYIDRNNTKHLNESFALKPSDIGSVAGELIHRMMEKMGSDI